MADAAKDAWVARVLAVKIGASTDPAAARGGGEARSAAVGELRNRLRDVLLQTASLPDAAKADLQARVRQAAANDMAADPARLAAMVEELESALAHAASAARLAEATSVAAGVASYRRLQFEWREAQDRAREQLDQFITVVLADPEVQADPKFEELEQATGEIRGQMPVFGSDIEAALGAIDDAGDDAARASARTAARQVLQGYTATLDDADGLRQLQDLSDEEYGGISFFGALRQALLSLDSQLAGAD